MYNPAPAAELLLTARRPGKRLTELPEMVAPVNLEQAYAVQDHLADLLARDRGIPAGYKIGCTNQSAREMLALDSPISGRCFTKDIRRCPAILQSSELHMIGVEPEIAIRVAANMSDDEPWTAERAATVVASVMPAVEIVESRFSTWPSMGILAAIADNGVHRQLILGEPISGWDRQSIEATEVSLRVDGSKVREGHANNVDGGPFSALAWLANHLNKQGQQVQSGDVITTGVMTDIFDGMAGQHVVADYGPLGVIQLEIV